ncbi:hypothetical protein T492DRAFT_289670 [Pavlovales sp. CCMP2436]|nr:hypothetical protein T492DRAFT_289670 [Pavlovales sp. CCMP2436]
MLVATFLRWPLSQSLAPVAAGIHRVQRGDVVARARGHLRKQNTHAGLRVHARVKVADQDARGVKNSSGRPAWPFRLTREQFARVNTPLQLGCVKLLVCWLMIVFQKL